MNFDFSKHIVLEDERVLIRPMEENDQQYLTDLLLDAALSKYSLNMIYTETDALAYIENCIQDRKNKIRYPFIFFDKKAKAYAGTSCFGNIVNPHKRLEIGWTKLAKPFQGTGLNTHCKFLLLQYCFDTLNANRVELKSHSENIQSRKAMEKIGASYEGTFRRHFLMYDGSWRDSVYYSILQEEWTAVKIRLQKLMSGV